MSGNSRMKIFPEEFRPEQFPLGIAYVPMQGNIIMYDNLMKAFQAGTIFPCLDKPFTGRRCVR
ncbi:MAG: spore coat associated protein CotJA [Lachnospiraceae bacterium]